MLRCIARAVTIFALCCAIGLQWVALQSFAWTSMLIEYSKRGPLCQAIAQTFDGAHPCSLCHIVNQGKASEKKSDTQSPAPKIDIICITRTIRLMSPATLFEYASQVFALFETRQSPPVPPPRAILL